MLYNLKDILTLAEKSKLAAGAFNAPNLESALGILSAAEELHLPVIIQHAQCHAALLSIDILAPILLSLAQKATVPVCIHLDHGVSLDYIQKALELGFTSVMFDGSSLSFEDNLILTRKVRKIASGYGASVEAELGCMGKSESGNGETLNDPDKIYTNPGQAATFVKETGIDALACSFGTTHGIYLTEPRLDFEIISRVRMETGGIPIVMHGGSGVTPQNFQAAISKGVRKINYFTYMDKAGADTVIERLSRHTPESPLFFHEISSWGQEGMRQDVRQAMQIFAGVRGEAAQ